MTSQYLESISNILSQMAQFTDMFVFQAVDCTA